MSLQVWLPLNGDLHNQGLSDLTVTNNGAIINNNGKIGKCYQFGTTSSYMTLPKEAMTSFTTEASVCFWLKIISWNTSYATYFQAGLGSNSWVHYIFGLLRNSANSTCCFTISNGSSTSNASYLTPTLSLNTWYHIALTYKTGHCLIYINGQLYQDYTTSIIPNFANVTKITLGTSNVTSSYQTNCLMNDFRIYDHCLSKKEVEEISKGLILHYQFNRTGLEPSNLIKNGFGEFGSDNWGTPGNISTSDLPSGETNIKIKITENTTNNFIKIDSTHKYKFSSWIKAKTTSGNTYPSLLPYDIDGKFIANYHCGDGFNLNTMTTLSQELKPGDTKVYVTSLSQWNANSGHYYNWAAVFDYVDNEGNIYPEGEYTQNCLQFGVNTNAKTNLDKANNIITLIDAYDGPTMPIGTKICASTAGSTYFYPLGGIALTTVQDWTYKEGVFFGSSRRLKYAKTVKFYTGYNNYMAGIKMQDLTIEDMDNNIIYDSSGYSNNATITGNLLYIESSPKYNISIYQDDGLVNYIKTKEKIYVPTDTITMNIWIKSNNKSPKGAYHDPFCAYTNPSTFEMSIYMTGYLRGGFYISGTRVCDNCTSLKLLDGNWHMITITYDGAAIKKYVDAILEKTTAAVGTLTSPMDFAFGRYGSGTAYSSNEMAYSDARIYATALTEMQIKELYDTSVSIDSFGNIYSRELVEL